MPNPKLHNPLTLEEFDELMLLSRRINYDDIISEEDFERYIILETRRLRTQVYQRLEGRINLVAMQQDMAA